MFKIDDDPESSNERACLKHLMKWNRQMWGRVKTPVI